MKILVYADLHNKKPTFPDVQPDVVFLLGDIHWQYIKEIDEHYDCKKFGVLGNHDGLDYFNHTTVVNLHGKSEVFEGVTIAGFGGSPKYNDKQNSAQYTDMEADEFIRNIGEVDIFISHSNPAVEGFRSLTDGHRGFLSLKNLMDEESVKYLFHGHIHENKEYVYKKTGVVVTYGVRGIEL